MNFYNVFPQEVHISSNISIMHFNTYVLLLKAVLQVHKTYWICNIYISMTIQL